MKPVIVDPDAEIELDRVKADYQSIRPALAIDFVDQFEKTINRIRRNPLLYPVTQKRVRLAPMKRFPYAVVYVELTSMIYVLALSHHRRKPGYWIKRLP